MNLRRVLFVVLIMGLWAFSALAATPEGGVVDNRIHTMNVPADKAFGDPTDFMAAASAGANYIRFMQSDITEDNAGNGDPDNDNQDGGWDWATNIYVHSTSGSPSNLYGVTAAALYEQYLRDPSPEMWTAMTDAADFMADPLNGPNTVYDIDSSPDVTFLMKYADLPGAVNPTYYRDAAKAMWDDRKTLGGGSSASDYITYLYTNWVQNSGIEAWDTASFCEGCLMLNEHYGAPYLDDANEIADYFYNDSFDTDNNGLGWFLVEDTGHGYREYTIGVTGLINMFYMTGRHTDMLPILNDLLLECQNVDGSFNYYYGATGDSENQSTAYAIRALSCCLPENQENNDALYDAALWLGTVQGSSGEFMESDGNHYPEIGAECAVALFYAADTPRVTIAAGVDEDLLNCSEGSLMTFAIDLGDNVPLVIGFEFVVDITALTLPTTINFTPATTPVAGFFQVTGNVNHIGSGVYEVTGAGPYSVNASFFSGAGISTDSNLFTVTFDGLSEGAVDVDVVSYNLRGPDNVFIFGDVSGAGFVVDCTAPVAVTDITADPHHNRVEVNWNHDGSDVDHYEVFSGLWHDGAYVSVYPEYDDVSNVIPTRPADYAAVLANFVEWAYIGDVAVLTVDETWTNADDRGVYYYEVFAVDAAGNASPTAAANDRATNYWLGDMYETGTVGPGDMTYLGAAFGTTSSDVDYLPNADVGPTDDWSRVGIPTTDNAINFEDLMVFSMNFGVVSTTNKSETNISTTADLSWVRYDEGTYALRLNNATGLKGVHLRASLPEGVSVTVTAGDLLDQQSEMTFLRNIGEDLDVSLAITGVDNGFVGQGDLFIVECSADLAMEDIVIDLRGSDNSSIEVSLASDAGDLTPRVFSLNAAFPNPFNPMTKISFSLPESQDVRLNVYGIDGKLVATLVNETRGAGLHEVIWNGQNNSGQVQASGLYFYRIEAGPYSQVQKMTLMK